MKKPLNVGVFKVPDNIDTMTDPEIEAFLLKTLSTLTGRDVKVARKK